MKLLKCEPSSAIGGIPVGGVIYSAPAADTILNEMCPRESQVISFAA